MGRRAAAWTWSKVSTIHTNRPAHGNVCDGEIRSYRFRYYAPSDSSYERCIGLTWCSSSSLAFAYAVRGRRILISPDDFDDIVEQFLSAAHRRHQACLVGMLLIVF